MIVVDASVWVSHLRPQDVNHQATRVWLESYVNGGGQIIGPLLLLAEVAGPIARRTGQPALAQQVIATLSNLAELTLVELDRTLALAAANIAANLRLRGADAVYVALAQTMNLSLITWNQEQLSRASTIIQARTP